MWHWELPSWNPDEVKRQVEEAVARGERTYPVWRWPMLRSYNGAPGPVRVEAWKRMKVARAMGLIPVYQVCSVCGARGRTQYHNEDYYRPMEAKPICSSCHLALHNRFRNPDRWAALVKRFAVPGCWFADLAMSQNTKPCRIKSRDVR